MIDLVAAVATHLRADAGVMAAFDGSVFAEKAPPDTFVPFVVIRPATSIPPFADVDTWEVASVLIDVVGDPDDPRGLNEKAGLVRSAVSKMRGTAPSGVVVQSVEPIAAAFGYDPSFTPALPRWVLTAQMVVRSITPEGVVA